jgi:hypothetical protein
MGYPVMNRGSISPRGDYLRPDWFSDPLILLVNGHRGFFSTGVKLPRTPTSAEIKNA